MRLHYSQNGLEFMIPAIAKKEQQHIQRYDFNKEKFRNLH